MRKIDSHVWQKTGTTIRTSRQGPASLPRSESHSQEAGSPRLAQALNIPKQRSVELPPVHGFHPYPGRCHPYIARALLQQIKARNGSRLFDPFMGGGTFLVEGMCREFEVLGNDLNPIASLTARERCRPRTPLESRGVFETAARLRQRIIAGEGSAEKKIILRRNVTWLKPHYAPHLFVELLSWIDAIDKISPSPVRDTLRAVFVSLVFRFSNEFTDPDGERKTPSIRKGVISRRMLQQTETLLKAQNDFKRKISLKTKAATISVKDINWLGAIENDFLEKPVDLIVTHPPLPDAYDYYRHYELQLKWLDLPHKDLKHHEIGPRRMSGRQWKPHFREILFKLRKLLKPGGSCYLIFHDWQENDTPVDALAYFKKYAPSVGWTFRESASLERPARFYEKYDRREHLIHLENPLPYKPRKGVSPGKKKHPTFTSS